MNERKRVLTVGGGAREHAIGWKIKKDNPNAELIFAPGNGGTENIGTNLDIDSSDIDRLRAFAKDNRVTDTVIGPERPLVDGIVDAFREDGLEIFGHTQKAALLEGDKARAVEFMRKNNIPHPPSAIFTDYQEAEAFIKSKLKWGEIVVKTSGLADGKGVLLPNSEKEELEAIRRMMIDKEFGEAGKKIVIQKRIKGREVSLIGFVVDKHFGLLVPAQDYKRANDGDQGPNTGGMGAYAPNEYATSDFLQTARDTIVDPTLSGARDEELPLNGFMYFGLMKDEETGIIYLLEYNMRLGDPETQVQMRLLDSNLLEAIEACMRGELEPQHYKSSEKSAVAVVIAAQGYPGPDYKKGMKIKGFDNLPQDIVVFHAGSKRNENEELVTTGGRILTLTATGETPQDAAEKIYNIDTEVNSIKSTFMRPDIAA
ncbi:MAG: phosphoribosylamine--glycine ligase [Patescibacteria group bacterium]